MAYNNLNFNVDKPVQYKELQIQMASIYKKQDQSLFGRVKVEDLLKDFENLKT